MARMVFGNWSSDEVKPAKVDHFRRPGGVTACGRRITRGMSTWSAERMVTCPRCLRALAKGSER